MLLIFAFVYDARIDTLISRVESQTVSQYIQKLQDFGTRVYRSDTTLLVAQWIHDKFYQLGADTVFYQTFFYEGQMQRNVIARFYGDSSYLARVIVGAHHDSRPYTGPAPGADDNASGVSFLLTLAGILNQAEFNRTIELVAFAAEEPGLIGSDKYAQKLYSENDTFLLYLNADMIGGDIDYVNDAIVVERDEGNSQNSNDYLSHVYADTLAMAFIEYTTLDTEYGPIYASDYMPFEQRGFVTIGVFEEHMNSTYHSRYDVIDSLDIQYATQVVKGASAFVLYLAGVTKVLEDSTTSIPEVVDLGRELYVNVYDLSGRRLVEKAHPDRFESYIRGRGIYLIERIFERGKKIEKFLKGR